MTTPKLTAADALLYEVAGSPIAGWVSNPFLQSLLSRYYAWKVNRKYQRYLAFYTRPQIIADLNRYLAETQQQKPKIETP